MSTSRSASNASVSSSRVSPEPDHQRALRVDRRSRLGAHGLGALEDAEGSVPARPLADRLLEPSDGLEVVVEDVRPGVHDVRSGASAPLKSGMRTSTPMPGVRSRNPRIVSAKTCAPPSGRSSRATQVTTTCSRPMATTRLGDPPRLVVVEPGRPAGLHVAEAAGPGAGVAEDHDRGGALVPALPDVRAVGLLADGVEVQAAEQALEVVVVLARGHPGLDPVGVPAQRRAPSARRPTAAAAHGDRDRLVGAVAVAARAGRLEHGELAAPSGASLRAASRAGRPERVAQPVLERRGREAELAPRPCSAVAQYVTPTARRDDLAEVRLADQAARTARMTPERGPSGSRSRGQVVTAEPGRGRDRLARGRRGPTGRTLARPRRGRARRRSRPRGRRRGRGRCRCRRGPGTAACPRGRGGAARRRPSDRPGRRPGSAWTMTIGAPAAIRCSATSWAPYFVSSYQLRKPSARSRR